MYILSGAELFAKNGALLFYFALESHFSTPQ
jgi:hypothetical protein